MRDYIPLNFALMSDPFNWVILTLMVLIGGLALHLILPPETGTATPANLEATQ